MGTKQSLAPPRFGEWYDEITTGLTSMPRSMAVANANGIYSSQSLRLAYFTATKSFTSANVVLFSGQTAAGATPTLCRAGLYSIAANGDGTLIASTVNDTAMFAVANTAYSKAWSTPVAIVLGQRYALCGLVVTAATAPTFPGSNYFATAAVGGTEAGRAPRITGMMPGQADLPASFAAASITDLVNRMYGVILP